MKERKRKRRFDLPLNEKENSRLYWELSRRGAASSGERFPWRYENLAAEDLLSLSFLQSRYDPRLLAVLVDYFKSPRPNINPVTFKIALKSRGVLPAAAVVAEWVLSSGPILQEQAREFALFLQAGVAPVPTQLFFRGLYPLAGQKMEEATAKSPWPFKKWGFLASDPPLLKGDPSDKVYLYDLPSRLQILKGLFRERPCIRLKDYLEKVGFSISRQQALKDLTSAEGIRKRGKGKGTRYEFLIKN